MIKRWKFLNLLLWVLLLFSCAPKPGPQLASKATLIQLKISTKSEVLYFFGPPVQSFLTQDGKEEWYYYYRVKNFWESIPVAKKIKGLDYTEVLKVVFQGEVVEEVHYYTVWPPKTN